MNNIFLSGNIGQKPELKHTNGATARAVCNFSLAERGLKKGDETVWHRVVCWEKTAESVAQYMDKGAGVNVMGRLTYRTWKDKEGIERITAEIVAANVEFTDKKGDSQRSEAHGGGYQSSGRQAQRDEPFGGRQPGEDIDEPF